jgi:hypothetical protein
MKYIFYNIYIAMYAHKSVPKIPKIYSFIQELAQPIYTLTSCSKYFLGRIWSIWPGLGRKNRIRAQ